MKSLLSTLGISLSLLMVSCNTPTEPDEKELGYLYKKDKKATGTVEVMKLHNNGNQNNDKIMIADFNAHEEHDGQSANGTFLFSVLNIDSSPHRNVTIDIDWVYVEDNTNKAWFKGVVTEDTKGCAGVSQRMLELAIEPSINSLQRSATAANRSSVDNAAMASRNFRF